MTIKRLLFIIGAALLSMLINIILSVLYLVIYSYLINPGHEAQFYQEYAQTAAPYSSIVTGIPVLYLVCRWIAGKWDQDFAVKAALLVWLVYAVIDLSILTAAGWTARSAVLSLISMSTKLLAAYFGGKSAEKKRSRV